MSDYSKGLRHGREDLAKMIAEELAADVTTDAEKLERIAWLVTAQTDDGAALPVRRDGGDAPAAAPSSPPLASREHLARVLDPVAFDEDKPRSKHPAAVIQWAARQHIAYEGADRLLAAAVFRDEATVKAEALEPIRRYFANGGPDTPIRTTWPDGVECWELPAADMRELLDGGQS